MAAFASTVLMNCLLGVAAGFQLRAPAAILLAVAIALAAATVAGLLGWSWSAAAAIACAGLIAFQIAYLAGLSLAVRRERRRSDPPHRSARARPSDSGAPTAHEP
jgi:hypothetical protein